MRILVVDDERFAARASREGGPVGAAVPT